LSVVEDKESTMRISMRVASFLSMVTLFIVTSASAEVYRNKEFGIEISIPKGIYLCPRPIREHNHGALLLLDAIDAKHCTDFREARFRSIAIFAFFNALDVARSLNGLLEWDCVEVSKGTCGPAPNDLKIAGLPSLAARVDHSDGWIDIIVVTQAGTPNPYDPNVPSINYDIHLQTKPEYLEEDLDSLRMILKTARFSSNAEK
jgi:hypothetical protein